METKCQVGFADDSKIACRNLKARAPTADWGPLPTAFSKDDSAPLRSGGLDSLSASAFQVKDKYQRMKTNFTRFFEIVKHTGVGWDADTNTVTADSDVWDMFIKGKQKQHIDLEEDSDESDDPAHVAQPILTESRRRVPKRSQSKSSQMQECMDIFRESFTKNQQDTTSSAKKRSDVRFFESFRMEPHVFRNLCDTLRMSCGITDSRKGVTVEEQVGMFLLVISHSMRFSMVAERFQHSKETVSQVIKKVARGIQEVSADFITSRNVLIQPEIVNDERWRFFRHCIGAIDGTHVAACMPQANRVLYRDRNADILQNVLAVCSRDMMFTYVMTGWEGSAHDSRVFADAASLESFPALRGRQYYVVDAGFSNIPGYLAPYKGERLFLEYSNVWADYDEFRNPPVQEGNRVDVDMNSDEMNNVRDRIATRLWLAKGGGR
ncbi:hypothetical protein CRG98_011078 [Punica granatum]|uniref:DDE Tnp4 domain-containing protein n=1 Tax=Punica granatum TaxID=22663 RepID=A0A2I0KJA4_PUNGR|nr:hypothetical protein CRG98_011078 [Punica granatum]